MSEIRESERVNFLHNTKGGKGTVKHFPILASSEFVSIVGRNFSQLQSEKIKEPGMNRSAIAGLRVGLRVVYFRFPERIEPMRIKIRR